MSNQSGGSINRPAQNARQVKPGEVLNAAPTFAAGSGAADFLGLNNDLQGAAAPRAQAAPAPAPVQHQPVIQRQPPAPAQHPAQPVMQRPAQPAPVAPRALPAPQPAAQPQQQSDSWLLKMEDRAERAEVEAPQVQVVDADADSDEEPASQALLNTSWKEDKPERKRRRWVAPVAAGAALAALALVGWPMLRKDAPKVDSGASESTKVATASLTVPSEEKPLSIVEHDESGPARPTEEDETDDISPPASTAKVYTPPALDPQPDPRPTTRQEIAHESSGTALEEGGLVEVVDPGAARSLIGECTEESKPDDVEAALAAELAAEVALAEATPSEPEREIDVAVSRPMLGEPALDEPETESVATPEPAPQAPVESEPEVIASADPIDTEPVEDETEPIVEPEPEPAPVARVEPKPIEPAPAARIEPKPIEPAPIARVEPAPSKPVEPAPAKPLEPAPSVAISAPPPVVEPKPAPESAATKVAPVAAAPQVEPGFVGAPFSGQPSETNAPAVYGPVAPAGAPMSPAVAVAPEAQSGNPRTTQLEVEDVLMIGRSNAGMRTLTATELKGVWTESTIPLDAVGNKTKLLTPSVGKVRALLISGEVFEGNLYAVGEGQVWIDTQYGRMGLQSSRVKSVTQVDAPKNVPALQGQEPGERVRIKTPGGLMYGKLISREGDQATVVTDDGARLTVPSKDVDTLTEKPKTSLKGG